MKIYEKGLCKFINDNSLKTSYFDDENLWGKADLICIDPPYGIGQKGKVTKAHGKVLSNREAWGDTFQDEFSNQEYSDLITSFCTKSFSLLSNGGSFFAFIDRKYAGNLTRIAGQCGFLYKNMVTFVKVNSVPKLRTTNFGSAFELGLWFIKPNSGRTGKGSKISPTKPKIFNSLSPTKGCRHKDGTLDIKRYHNTCSSNAFFGNIGCKRTGHACEKYVWQIKPIIEHLSLSAKDGGGLVVDLCAGGFNSGLVCQELGRKYIGIEINADFWEKGVGLLCNLLESQSTKNIPWKPPNHLKIQKIQKKK